MNSKSAKCTLSRRCELDPRYQNLIAAFRQVIGGEKLAQLQTYLLLLQIARRLIHAEQALFDRYKLSEGKLSVLLLLLKQTPQNQLTPSEIAEATNVTRGTMTGLLAGLERDGFVIRKPDANDRRRSTIQATPRSMKVLNQLLLERSQHIEKLLSCLPPGEVEQQRAILEKLDTQLAGGTEL